MNKSSFNILLIFAVICLHSCQITKKIPKDCYLLTRNIFIVNGKKTFSPELSNQVKQIPNYKILGFPIKLGLHNLFDSKLEKVFDDYFSSNSIYDRKRSYLNELLKKEGLGAYLKKKLWFEKILYKNREKPVFFDQKLSFDSAKSIDDYYLSNGYFDALTQVDFFLKNKKAKVTYTIQSGNPYIIASIKYEFDNQELKKIYFENKHNSSLKENIIYNKKLLDKEADFLEELFRNNGYFKFKSKEGSLNFEVDSTKEKNKVHILMKVKEKNPDDHVKFQIGKVFLNLKNNDFSIKKKYEYKKFHIELPTSLNYKFKRLASFLSISPESIYKEKEINNAKKILYKLENFHLNFNESIRNNFIDYTITLSPLERHELQFSFEGSTSRHFDLGITPGIRLLSRNIFGGAENLDLSLRGTIASIKNKNSSTYFFNAAELNFQSELSFPYFLAPFNVVPLIAKKYLPKTSILFRATTQKNIGIGRLILSNFLKYNWATSLYKSYQLDVFGIELVQNFEKNKYFNFYSNDRRIRENFIKFYQEKNKTKIENDIAENELLKKASKMAKNHNLNEKIEKDIVSAYIRMYSRRNRIIEDNLMTSLSYNYLYDGREKENKKNPLFFMGKIESSGNFLSLFRKSSLFKKIDKDSNHLTYYLFGLIPYAQFIKLDLDFRKYWIFSKFNELIFRSFLGVGVPYGNSKNLPFTRSYFGGGPNDIRAWRAYDVGPGSTKNELQDLSFSDIKLTLNMEFRFKIISNLLGAVFLDAGNIWSIKEKDEEGFFIHKFYKQLALGGGVGLRWSLTYFILRGDFGYKIYDPSKEVDKWVLNKSIKKFPTLNLAIGYPF